ncbi:hypothetical protein [Burkholderia contaminans]|uniref:hypothetical protein n=1 Tax=Burkholderia contaminans TaxID=488447 RepID=UPI003D673394
MEISIQKRLLEYLHLDPVRSGYTMLVWNSLIGGTPFQGVMPVPVKYRVEIRPEGYIVVIPR